MKTPVIAQIVQHIAPGGIETMVLDLKSAAVDPNKVHIVSLEGKLNNFINQWSKIKNIDRLYALDKPSGVHLKTIIKLIRFLKRNNVDIVHTHHVGPLIYGGIAAKVLGCKHVHTEHDAWHLSNKKRRILVKILFFLLRPIIVADCQLVKKNIQSFIKNYPISVVMNGIDIERFKEGDANEARKKLNLPLHNKIIGCAARLTEVKGHSILFRAFSKLSSDTHLALAGGGELEEFLIKLAKELGILNRVHFLGSLSYMQSFYHAIDIFCLSSLKEGLPLSPLEAQACQRNVVLTDVGGCREAVSSSGMIVKSDDVTALYQGLKYQLLHGCSDENRKLARNFVIKNGNLSVMVKQYQALYLGNEK